MEPLFWLGLALTIGCLTIAYVKGRFQYAEKEENEAFEHRYNETKRKLENWQ